MFWKFGKRRLFNSLTEVMLPRDKTERNTESPGLRGGAVGRGLVPSGFVSCIRQIANVFDPSMCGLFFILTFSLLKFISFKCYFL